MSANLSNQSYLSISDLRKTLESEEYQLELNQKVEEEAWAGKRQASEKLWEETVQINMIRLKLDILNFWHAWLNYLQYLPIQDVEMQVRTYFELGGLCRVKEHLISQSQQDFSTYVDARQAILTEKGYAPLEKYYDSFFQSKISSCETILDKNTASSVVKQRLTEYEQAAKKVADNLIRAFSLRPAESNKIRGKMSEVQKQISALQKEHDTLQTHQDEFAYQIFVEKPDEFKKSSEHYRQELIKTIDHSLYMACAKEDYLKARSMIMEVKGKKARREFVNEQIFGRYPIHVAAAMGNKLLVKLLRKYGADPNVRDIDNKTAVNCANENGHTHIFPKKRRFHFNFFTRLRERRALRARVKPQLTRSLLGG